MHFVVDSLLGMCIDSYRPDETLSQYLYEIMEITMHGGMEDESNYVIWGIPDVRNFLCVAVTIHEFEKIIDLYAWIKQRHRAESRVSLKAIEEKLTSVKTGTSCHAATAWWFNYGDRGHQSRECLDINKRPYYLSCRTFGHKSL